MTLSPSFSVGFLSVFCGFLWFSVGFLSCRRAHQNPFEASPANKNEKKMTLASFLRIRVRC